MGGPFLYYTGLRNQYFFQSWPNGQAEVGCTVIVFFKSSPVPVVGSLIPRPHPRGKGSGELWVESLPGPVMQLMVPPTGWSPRTTYVAIGSPPGLVVLP